MLAAGRYLYVPFCCQQALEKHLKGLIVERCGMFPPRTHDLKNASLLRDRSSHQKRSQGVQKGRSVRPQRVKRRIVP